jgi:hypothetical protein
MRDRFAREMWEEFEEVVRPLESVYTRQRLRFLLRKVIRARGRALEKSRGAPEGLVPAEVAEEVRREAVARWGEEVAELEHRQQATDGALACVRQYALACARRGAEGAGVCAVVNDLLVRQGVAEAATVAGPERAMRHEHRVLVGRARWLLEEARRLAAENRRLAEENRALLTERKFLRKANRWLLDS